MANGNEHRVLRPPVRSDEPLNALYAPACPRPHVLSAHPYVLRRPFPRLHASLFLATIKAIRKAFTPRHY